MEIYKIQFDLHVFFQILMTESIFESTISNCINCNETIHDTQENYKDGFLVCFECGTTQDTILISSNVHWKNDGSNIQSIFTKNQVGCDLNSGNSSKKWSFHQWNNVSSKQRHLYNIKKEMQEYNVPKPVLDDAYNLYTRLYMNMTEYHGTKRCTLRKGLQAACIYYSFRQSNTPIEKKDIASMCYITNKMVTKGCNHFLNVMGDEFIKLETYKAVDFLPKYCNLFKLDETIKLLVEKLLVYIQENDTTLNETTPTNIICSCIYYIIKTLDLDIQQKDFYKVTGISPIVIKRIVPQIEKHDDYIKSLT